VLIWTCTVAAAGFSAALLFLDWNSWVFTGAIRFLVGVPIALLGGLLALWGVATIGWRNSSGVRDGFVPAGPYRFTRNPQYVGDAALPLSRSLQPNHPAGSDSREVSRGIRPARPDAGMPAEARGWRTGYRAGMLP